MEEKVPLVVPGDEFRRQLVECFEQRRQLAFLRQGDDVAARLQDLVGPSAEQLPEQGGSRAALESGRRLQGRQAVEIVARTVVGRSESTLMTIERGGPVEMEGVELPGDRLLAQPDPDVAAQELGEETVEVVGELRGTARDSDVAQLAVIGREPDDGLVSAHQMGDLLQRDAHLVLTS